MIYATSLHAAQSLREQEYLEGWKRARAELANIKSRMEGDTDRFRQQARREAALKLLAVSDNFSALAEHVPEAIRSESWVEGVLHVARHLEQVLQEFGVQVVNPLGKQFDPRIHEAVQQVDAEEGNSGVVTDVIQPGYMMDDVVLRPARVKVGA